MADKSNLNRAKGRNIFLFPQVFLLNKILCKKMFKKGSAQLN